MPHKGSNHETKNVFVKSGFRDVGNIVLLMMANMANMYFFKQKSKHRSLKLYPLGYCVRSLSNG